MTTLSGHLHVSSSAEPAVPCPEPRRRHMEMNNAYNNAEMKTTSGVSTDSLTNNWGMGAAAASVACPTNSHSSSYSYPVSADVGCVVILPQLWRHI
jgi:hypothetical protein